MRGKFTAGPYFASLTCAGWRIRGDGKDIAYLPQHGQQIENARLFASAPDLYAALEQIDSLLDGGLPITHQVKSIARAALLKARGTEKDL